MSVDQVEGQSNYRPEIDGLRAIAVLSVVLFHLNEVFLPGGFIGVDVFFVISGYLISNHILSDITAGRFSFRNFYLKRARRILPALYAVILLVTILSIFLLVPEDIKSTARSAIQAIVYKANYYFAKNVDYFAPITKEHPLLHLWSLSVEEQFYFIFPILLFLISIPQAFQKKYRQYLLVTFVVIFLASVSSAEYGLSLKHLKKWTFYSLTSRASELLVGAMLAVSQLKIRSQKMAELVATVGFVILISGLILINQQMPFPGLVALLPCLATACLIAAHERNKTVVGKFLTLRPMVFIGLISYSLYLYHWPLIAFFKHKTESPTAEFLQATVIFIASLVFAYLSWRYIEVPFRRPTKDSINKSLLKIFLGPTLGLVAVLNLAIHIQSKLPFIDYTKLAKTLHYLDLEKYCHNRFDEKTCVFGDKESPPTTLLIGDSHAGHYQPFIEELGKIQKFSVIARSSDGCLPILGDNKEGYEKIELESACIEQITWASKNIDRFNTVIIAGAWTRYLDPQVFSKKTQTFYETELSAMVSRLVSKEKRVIFFEQIPLCSELDSFYGNRFSMKNILINEPEERQKVVAACGLESDKANLYFKTLVEKSGAEFVPALADFQEKISKMPFYGDEYFYKDGGHLNQTGSQFMGNWSGLHSVKLKGLSLPKQKKN